MNPFFGTSFLIKSFLCCVLILASCTSQEGDDSSSDQTEKIDEIFSPVFYKHLRGKIGTQAVVFDITSDGKTITGSYYYQSSGELINLSGKIDSLGSFELRESVNQKTSGSMVGKITTDSVSGTWYSTDKKSQVLLILQEDYYQSIALAPYFLHDTVSLTDSVDGPVGTFSKLVLVPKDSTSKLTELMKGFQFSAKKITTSTQSLLVGEMNAFKKSYLELRPDYSPEFGVSSYTWDNSSVNSVLYNDNGFISLRSSSYEFTGGAHGNFGSSCVVFSIDSLKEITIRDIFTKGFDKKLNQAINSQLRKNFDVQAGETLADAGFLVEYLTYSENFYITSRGIGFVYTPSEVATESLGEIEVFVPFDQVKSVLNQRFEIATSVKLQATSHKLLAFSYR